MPIKKERRKFETEFNTRIQLWLKYNARDIDVNRNIGPVEGKVSYDKRFNLKSGIKKHQLQNLMAISNGKTVLYKISDIDQLTRKPWDLDCYTNSIPFFAIMWNRPLNKIFYLVKPSIFKDAMNNGIASFTEEELIKEDVITGYLVK